MGLRALSSRERVERALRLEEPDRVPVMDTLLPGFRIRYMDARGLLDSVDLDERFGFDIRKVSCNSGPRLLTNAC